MRTGDRTSKIQKSHRSLFWSQDYRASATGGGILLGQLGVHAGMNILSESWPNAEDKEEKNPAKFPRLHGYSSNSALINLRPGSKGSQRFKRNRYVPGGAAELTTVTTRKQTTIFPILGPAAAHTMQPTVTMTAIALATAAGGNDRQTRVFEQQNGRREAQLNTRADARWGKGRLGFDESQKKENLEDAQKCMSPHL